MAAPFADSPFRGTPSLARSASGNSVRKSWADLVEQNDKLQQDAAGAEGNLSNECLPSAVGNANCMHCATPGADSYGIPREDDRDDDNLVTLKISESPFHFSPPRSVLPDFRASPSSYSRKILFPPSPCGAVASAVGTTAANSSAIQQCKIVPIQWPVSESSGRPKWVGRSPESLVRCFNGSTHQSDHHARAERWLKDFGSAVVEHEWSYETAFRIIRGRFRGPALMWLKSNWQIFRENEGGLRAGWDKFWTEFEATFVLKDEKDLKDELEKRVQKHEESIEEYAAAIKELVRRLGYQVDDANVRFQLIRGLLDPGTRAKLETVLPATFADILRKVDDYQAYDCYCATMKTLSVSENTDQQLPKKHIAGEIEAVSGGTLVQKKTTVQESSTALTDTSGTSSSEQNTSRKCAPQQALAASELQEGIMAEKRTTSKNLHGHQNKSVISSAETAVNTKISRIQSSDLLLKNVAVPQPDNGTTVHGIVKGRNHCLPGYAVGNVVLFDQAAGVENMHNLPTRVNEQAPDQNQIRHPSRNRKQKLWSQKLRQSTITGKTK